MIYAIVILGYLYNFYIVLLIAYVNPGPRRKFKILDWVKLAIPFSYLLLRIFYFIIRPWRRRRW